MYYCPKCGKFELDFNGVEQSKNKTVGNCRDGYGRPIQHYLCECGNPLAGTMWIEDKTDLGLIEYSKDIITQYNEGGDYFVQGLLDYANKYKERILQRSR